MAIFLSLKKRMAISIDWILAGEVLLGESLMPPVVRIIFVTEL
jgi:hypothetical protein